MNDPFEPVYVFIGFLAVASVLIASGLFACTVLFPGIY